MKRAMTASGQPLICLNNYKFSDKPCFFLLCLSEITDIQEHEKSEENI